MSEEVPLKYEKIEKSKLIRGDVVLHEGGIWQCVIKNANLFLNIESKEQMEVNREWYLRVNKVELIPH